MVIRALDPLKISDTVRGQYRANSQDGSYLDHVGNPALVDDEAVGQAQPGREAHAAGATRFRLGAIRRSLFGTG